MRLRDVWIVIVCLVACALAEASGATARPRRPNIVFIIMDDVGIDQLPAFGYGGAGPSRTPVMDTVASGGLRFRNVWSMPECSPSRAAMFTGRYPLRTNIYAPLLPVDLANSQLSPYDTTVPRLLEHAGYTSALFGKFHMGGPHNNPYGNDSPMSVGFDHFHGPLGDLSAGAAPDPIDTTAGGVAPEGTYGCGFVPNAQVDPDNGANSGACYFADDTCVAISTSDAQHPGRACLERGGIFAPEAACQAERPQNLDFDRTNAYYVWSIGESSPVDHSVRPIPRSDPRSRTYWPTEITQAAIDWISAPHGGPWMVTLAYPSIHAPYQPAPASLTPGGDDLGGACCTCAADTQALSDQMLQAMDTEIGRLLVATGVASRRGDGRLSYDPGASDTVVVIVGDNGSYAPSVKPPFDANRSKGSVYQTGVWVPLIVAGPPVRSPNRSVESTVNVADLFQLFGELAGLDVRRIVPRARLLDSVSMLPYLEHPSPPSIRRYNFTQSASANITANNERPGPCVLSGTTCLQLMVDREMCEAEGGIWYGEGADGQSFESCCELKAQPGMENLKLRPLAQSAVRNDTFKLVRTTHEGCSQPDPTVYELYEVDEAVPDPRLDRIEANLITSQSDPRDGLTREQAKSFRLLAQELERVLSSEIECPGDGNKDGIVDEQDVRNWSSFQDADSSWYDFPARGTDGTAVYDGVTDEKDLEVILDSLGERCPHK